MKNILITIIAALTVTSCTDFLAEDPKDIITSVNFYQNEADAKAAIAGAYASLGNEYYGNWEYYAFNVLHSGAANGRGSQGPITIYDQVLDQRNIDRASNIWGRIYTGINRANAVLDNVPLIEDMDAGLKTQILAEAHFLRALAYFELVRGWGPVPLRLTETRGLDAVAAPRASEDEVYAQIIADAQVAEKDLPEVQAEGTGRASKWAAKMLLAQVHLTRENWTAARDLAEEVINSSLFSLVLVDEPDDFYQLFRVKTHTEDIMSRQHSENSQSEIPNFLHLTNIPVYNPSGSGFFAWLPIANSYIGESWDDNDLRKAFNLYTEYVDADGNTVPLPETTPLLFKKFIDDENGLQTFSVPMFRYTEAFLIYAEAASQAEGGPSSTALERLNAIKRRGYGYDPFAVSPVDYPAGMSQEEFRDAVLKERDYEFLLERRRWWDLKRTNRVFSYFESIDRPIIPERLLWPLPENEINTNPALGPEDQNPGY